MYYTYDGSFEGFLTVIFEAFREKTEPEAILPLRGNMQMPLGELTAISRNEEKAQRVWAGLERKTSVENARLVHTAFLAQEAQTESLLWRYLKKVFTSTSDGFYRNMLDEDVFNLVQMARRVRLEVHRFNGFVRFQKTEGGLYFAPIDPDHDIVRLLSGHFKSRFADQPWIIYDTRRNYGIWYDKEVVREVVFDNLSIDLLTGDVAPHVRDIDEPFYCQLWQVYYDAINIKERKNHRQMKHFMPRRYWKYLPEKRKK